MQVYCEALRVIEAPRGEFVCKHFRPLALGVALPNGSHVSRTFLWAINESTDALAVQFSSAAGLWCCVVECVRGALAASCSHRFYGRASS